MIRDIRSIKTNYYRDSKDNAKCEEDPEIDLDLILTKSQIESHDYGNRCNIEHNSEQEQIIKRIL